MRMPPNPDYHFLLSSEAGAQWQSIGIQRRAGFATPLFSVYSKDSTGIGEFPDIKKVVDWAAKTNQSIIQLLPLNDMGFDFCPYDSRSSFALDPVYLSLKKLVGATPKDWTAKTKALKEQFPVATERVDYRIKQAKLDWLWEVFESNAPHYDKNFQKFCRSQQFWLEDYACFCVIKDQYHQEPWEDFPKGLKDREPKALAAFKRDHAGQIHFYQWLQFQCYQQMSDVKKYAQKKDVCLMGDIPFLVARDSADVWVFQDYFKLDLEAGAPSDGFCAKGQRWGMPPYEWSKIEAHDFDYLKNKLQYAESFYHMYRIDHVIGCFRLWVIGRDEDIENQGLNGRFDPPEETQWIAQGEKILRVMLAGTVMLPCAEDLGVVPDAVKALLNHFGILGMDVQRWKRNWHTDKQFTSPEHYRKDAIAILSTHDTSSLSSWLLHEVGRINRSFFELFCEQRELDRERIMQDLFDLESSSEDFLCLKPEIINKDKFMWFVGVPHEEAGDLIAAFEQALTEAYDLASFLGVSLEQLDFNDTGLIRRLIEKMAQSACIFSIQLLQDLLAISGDPCFKREEFRLNKPGTVSGHNWTLRMPYPLEEMLKFSGNKVLKRVCKRA